MAVPVTPGHSVGGSAVAPSVALALMVVVTLVPVRGPVVVSTGTRGLQRHRGQCPGTMAQVVQALMETQRAPPRPGQEGQAIIRARRRCAGERVMDPMVPVSAGGSQRPPGPEARPRGGMTHIRRF